MEEIAKLISLNASNGFDACKRKRSQEVVISKDEKRLELRLRPPGEDQHLQCLQRAAAAVNLHDLNSSRKSKYCRPGVAPVVGWPPVRSWRKNSAKQSNEQKLPDLVTPKVCQIPGDSLFVKVNMEGVPIGRKVDLKTCDSYEKLSTLVDELFRGLLEAQGGDDLGSLNGKEGTEEVGAGLSETGRYTLIYEDNEGDRILVGDVPWHMFISSAKRLRLLKDSQLSIVCIGSRKPGPLSPLP